MYIFVSYTKLVLVFEEIIHSFIKLQNLVGYRERLWVGYDAFYTFQCFTQFVWLLHTALWHKIGVMPLGMVYVSFEYISHNVTQCYFTQCIICSVNNLLHTAIQCFIATRWVGIVCHILWLYMDCLNSFLSQLWTYMYSTTFIIIYNL